MSGWLERRRLPIGNRRPGNSGKPKGSPGPGGGNGGGTGGGGRGRGRGGSGGSNTPQPTFANVLFLSGFEGSDGDTTFPNDESTYGRTVTGRNFKSQQIDTDQFKFGSSSLYTPSAGAAVDIPDSADWNFSGEFTVECWMRMPSKASNRSRLVSHYSYVGSNRSWRFEAGQDTNYLSFYWNLTGGTGPAHQSVTGSYTWAVDTWYHVAASRDASNTLRLFVDGVMLTSGTMTGTPYNSAYPLSVGGDNDAFNDADMATWNGWIDEVRISAECIYGSDDGFSVPTEAHPRA